MSNVWRLKKFHFCFAFFSYERFIKFNSFTSYYKKQNKTTRTKKQKKKQKTTVRDSGKVFINYCFVSSNKLRIN